MFKFLTKWFAPKNKVAHPEAPYKVEPPVLDKVAIVNAVEIQTAPSAEPAPKKRKPRSRKPQGQKETSKPRTKRPAKV